MDGCPGGSEDLWRKGGMAESKCFESKVFKYFIWKRKKKTQWRWVLHHVFSLPKTVGTLQECKLCTCISTMYNHYNLVFCWAGLDLGHSGGVDVLVRKMRLWIPPEVVVLWIWKSPVRPFLARNSLTLVRPCRWDFFMHRTGHHPRQKELQRWDSAVNVPVIPGWKIRGGYNLPIYQWHWKKAGETCGNLW